MVRAAVLVLALLALAAPAAAQQPPAGEPRIPPGVRAGGVDLSDLTVPEAEARLEQLLAGPLSADIVVAVAGRRFRLSPRRAKFEFDALRTAKRAYYAGVNNPPDQSAAGGAAAQLDVPLAVIFRRAKVRDFAGAIDRAVYVAPRNATLTITLRKMIRRRSAPGRDLDARALRATIEAALADPAASRLIKPGRKTVPAPINANDLVRRYRTVITIDKANFKLRLFKNLKLSKTYGVATGLPAYPTPSGRFAIQSKQINPTWTAPNSPWAGELAGSSVPGGAWNNPLKARWMGIANGVGIHGTGQEWSIGSRASHGCLRMRVRDVIDLFGRVPIGTPVLIR